LVEDGHDVVVLDNLTSGKKENLSSVPSARLVEGDVSDYETVLSTMPGIDWVFHQAAIASVPRTIEAPLASHRTNYQGTLNVLEAARQTNVTRVVLASTAAIYGDLPGLPKQEDMPAKPLSPYAMDKLASEQACQVYTRLYGLETVCLRYFNVFGPRQDPSSPYSGVISIFIDKLTSGDTPVIYGDGLQTRDFVFVEDVADANIRAAQASAVSGAVMNVCTGQGITIVELLEQLKSLYGCPSIQPEYRKARSGDIRESIGENTTLRTRLQWTQSTQVRVGLHRILQQLPRMTG
jgi:UDP-glucose 4-epimerase